MVPIVTKISGLLKNKWLRYAIFIVGGLIAILILRRVIRMLSFRNKLKVAGKGKQGLFSGKVGNKAENKMDRKAGRAFGKSRARFIKNPAKYSPTGVKLPAKTQREIRKYMKQHGGALPPDIQAELDRAMQETLE